MPRWVPSVEIMAADGISFAGQSFEEPCSCASTGLGHGTEGLPQPVPSALVSRPILRSHTVPSYLCGIHFDEILVKPENAQRAEYTGELRDVTN